MSLFHAFAIFLFGTRVLYGLPSVVYYQAEALVVLGYLGMAVFTKATASQHIKFAVSFALMFFCVLVRH